MIVSIFVDFAQSSEEETSTKTSNVSLSASFTMVSRTNGSIRGRCENDSILGAVHMSRASPANRADSILSPLMGD